MKEEKRSRALACACALALGLAPWWGAAAWAEPLRIDLEGRADPGPVSAAAPAAEAARFVPARPAAAASVDGDVGSASGDDEAREFVPALSLPRPQADPDVALPQPDESQGVLRLVRGDGATAAPPALPEPRPLGAFGRRVPGSDPAARALGNTFDETPAAEAAEADAFVAPRESGDARASAALPAAARDRRDASGHVRLITVFIVVPLVLAAMAMLWRLDRGGRHRRRHRHRHDGARARAHRG